MREINGPHRTGQIWLDLIVAGAALIISFASLWVALREGDTQARLLSASVWPYLQFGTSNISPSGVDQIDYTVENAGVGPAKIHWFTLYYHDKRYVNMYAALRVCCGAHGRLPTVTQSMENRVLMAREVAPFVHLPKVSSDLKTWKRLDHERFAFYVRTCYCSVLDECWLLDSRQQEPRPVHVCPPAEEPGFQG